IRPPLRSLSSLERLFFRQALENYPIKEGPWESLFKNERIGAGVSAWSPGFGRTEHHTGDTMKIEA
ncbi:MAG: hypothetical protein ACOWYE_05790, partial [Desulfatiglandales bacterium]